MARAALTGAVLLTWLSVACAEAKMVRIGPAIPSAVHASNACGIVVAPNGTRASAPDCALVNSWLPKGLVAVPAAGTIIRWRVGGFNGTARLLIFATTADGRYKIVARSRPRTRPCVKDGPGFCGPNFNTVYTFGAHLKVKPGELIGIELISPSPSFDQPTNARTSIGITGSSVLPISFTPTPPVNQPAIGNSDSPAPAGGDTVLVNADLKIRVRKRG